ncbi:Na(+)-translocating NADH-quinone reductase subunit A [hydrothermal vent metagenome]|uniref:Na(+)-translocating NADH-quinone reductase subunit A n=1 Tax=hydrothermal vent metagenome TaxID=652676 RepID=A0A3B0XSL1_9ZZZZ
MFKLKKGLDIPIANPPEQKIYDAPAVDRVALVGRDYIWRRGTLLVSVGDRVKKGQAIVQDKHLPEITGTSPGSGVIEAIHRGHKRVLDTIVIRLENEDDDQEVTFPAYKDDAIAGLTVDLIKENLLTSGLWSSFRTRPYNTLAEPATSPYAILVTAMDTNPLAPDPTVIINGAAEDFCRGVALISRLTEGKLFVCKSPSAQLPIEPLLAEKNFNIEVASFSGPHPAGLVGTHIHFLCPVSSTRMVWHIGYQDVIAIGCLFHTGKLDHHRIISLAGPAVKSPRLIRTRIGACTNELVQGELECENANCRVISGSVLSGYHASNTIAYLGRYHNQITVLSEGGKREMFKYLWPGRNLFSASHAFISSMLPKKRFAMNTSQNGSPRAMVPIGSYERVMPLDILATPLLRALVVKDTEAAQALGCLELDEEDLALCTFVDPGKYDFGPVLRANLLHIMQEG